MNTERLKQCGVDYDDGLNRFCGNAAMYDKYLKRLPALPLYGEMKSFIAEKNAAQAFEACHKLKAYVGNLSIPGLYKEIYALTELLRGGVIDEAALSAELEKADAEYNRVVPIIEEEAALE